MKPDEVEAAAERVATDVAAAEASPSA
jgi:hypothetical protein